MFRVSQHPSSGALKTVTATSGIDHNVGTATSFNVAWSSLDQATLKEELYQHYDLLSSLDQATLKEVAVPTLWPIPEVAVTVFSAPDDECCDTRNM